MVFAIDIGNTNIVIEEKLNNRPRKRLGYLTPNEKFNSILTN